MNIGLVLSGGMAKGAYQIGALKAISEFVPLSEIKYMSCASVGVLNGYAYATESLEKVEEVWRNICCDDTRQFISRVLRSSMLQQNIQKFYKPEAKMPKAFYCSLLDIGGKTMVYKNLSSVDKGQIPAYLKASVAMPIYNHAVSVDGASYFDGAMIDNIPVFPLLRHNLDYIICIYFDDICYKFENTYFDNKIIKLTFPPDNRLKQSLIFSKASTEIMLKDGYDRTTQLLETIFSKGYDDCDAVYGAIDSLNKACKTKSLRITGDVLVTRLNQVTQKLAKRKVVV